MVGRLQLVLPWIVPLVLGVLLVGLDGDKTTPAMLPAAIGVLLAMLVLFLRPAWALYLMVAAWPLHVISLPIKGLRMKLCQALLLLALGAWSLRLLVKRQGIYLPGVLVPFGAFITVAAASSFGGIAWRAPALLSQWLLFWITILAMTNLIDSPQTLRGVMTAHLLSGTANAVLGIIQSLTSFAGLTWFELYQVGRGQGLFTEPDWFGYYLLAVFFPVVTLLAADAWPQRRRWLQASLALVSLAMLLSQVRAAWLGLAVGLAGLAIWNHKQAFGLLKRTWVPVAVGVGLVVLVCLAAPDIAGGITKRFDSFADPNETANMYRLYMMDVTMAMIWENPIAGYGLGSWGPLVGLTGPNAVGTWNMIVSVWFDAGLFGLAALIWLVAHVWVTAVRAQRQAADPLMAIWLRGLLLGLIAMLVSNQFSDGSYFDFFWAYIGVLTAATRLAKPSISERSV